MMKDNFLFISKLYPESLISEFLQNSKIGLDFAAHNLSQAIRTGFQENNYEIDVINTPQLGSWPKFYKTPLVSQYEDEHLISVPYLNIMYFKRSSLERQVYKKIKQWCQSHSGIKRILLYNFNYIGVAKKIKRVFPDVKFCMIVTDLPEYMATKNNLLTSIINKTNHLQDKDKSYQYDAIDGLILLAKDMIEKLPITGKPWIQIEGIYNNENECEIVEKDSLKVIMYTGNLGARYGIMDLLKAFMRINDSNYRLWIRGNGECEALVKEYSCTDNRIKYFDKMSRKELQTMQQKATLLVNPVHSSEIFTRYFFPSKTLEYLASGTPTLMSHLQCIPHEYDDYLYYFNDESIEGMKNRMVEICEKPQFELYEFGRRASTFIKNTKTPKPQIKKVIEFLRQL